MAKDINGVLYAYENKDELAFGTSLDESPKLKAIFGTKSFVEVDNSVEAEDVNIKVYKEIQKLVRSKPTSPMAQAWIDNELAKKRR